jgi:tetratricopeptide (TPR) repeat protein
MKKIKFLVALAAAMCISAVASAQTLSDVSAKYNEAVELYKGKQFERAIPAMEAVIDMGLTVGPDASAAVDQAQKLLPDCYLRYGTSLCAQGKFEEGIVQLTQAVELGELYNTTVARQARTTIANAYRVMGGEAFNSKDYARAIEIFTKGYQVDPTNAQIALYLAESYAESGDLDNGLKIYRNIVALEARHSRYKPDADDAREKINYYVAVRANELAVNGLHEDAYTILSEVLADDPANADIHFERIRTAVNASHWNRVIEWGEEAAAAQTFPERQSDIYFYLGAAHQNTDNVPTAIAIYEKVTVGDNVANAKEQIKLLKNPPTK